MSHPAENGYTWYTGFLPVTGAYLTTNPTARAAITGVLVGGTGAMANNIRAYQDGYKDRNIAIRDAVTTALLTGTAAAVAERVSARMGRSGILPTVAALAAGTAVMYALTSPKTRKTDDTSRENEETK